MLGFRAPVLLTKLNVTDDKGNNSPCLHSMNDALSSLNTNHLVLMAANVSVRLGPQKLTLYMGLN